MCRKLWRLQQKNLPSKNVSMINYAGFDKTYCNYNVKSYCILLYLCCRAEVSDTLTYWSLDTSSNCSGGVRELFRLTEIHGSLRRSWAIPRASFWNNMPETPPEWAIKGSSRTAGCPWYRGAPELLQALPHPICKGVLSQPVKESHFSHRRAYELTALAGPGTK